MGCTVLEGLPAADLLSASQLHSEGIPLVIFDLLNLIVNPNPFELSLKDLRLFVPLVVHPVAYAVGL